MPNVREHQIFHIPHIISLFSAEPNGIQFILLILTPNSVYHTHKFVWVFGAVDTLNAQFVKTFIQFIEWIWEFCFSKAQFVKHNEFVILFNIWTYLLLSIFPFIFIGEIKIFNFLLLEWFQCKSLSETSIQRFLATSIDSALKHSQFQCFQYKIILCL